MPAQRTIELRRSVRESTPKAHLCHLNAESTPEGDKQGLAQDETMAVPGGTAMGLA